MSESTSCALRGRGAGCSSGDGTYLSGTVGLRRRLFKYCQNPPPRHCGAEVHVVEVLSEPTSQAMWGRGAGCLSTVRTYLPGTVGHGCRLFKGRKNLPPGHCGAGVHAV